ncbi:MAG: SemiSWEET transporter [Candidatus Omnitrophica bacterium]|nr:SemiSWEET transporter [Candidatus Omnitrophota bacterium]HOX54478.1 SemiSWEET transporter [Candidatus Omnitrophota bacterium]
MSSFAVGILAGTLCTISFIPQIVKIFKTRQAKDLSLITFSVFASGVFFWFIYGIMIKEFPVILANGITLVLVAIVIAAKLKFG